MTNLRRLARFLFLAVALTNLLAVSGRAAELIRREWQVDGVTREALVHIPAKAKADASPVIFAFHGHGGTMNRAAQMFGYEKLWPKAIVVYMQGLNTPGRLSDPDGKRPGWQHSAGNQGDRDLKFFDAVLASLKEEYRVDEKRIYATGFSNGGGFTYLLWQTRGDRFAAMAPAGAAAGEMMKLSKPKPALIIAGETDPLVKFEWQKRTMEAVRKLNECGEGKSGEKYCITYESKAGAPVITFIHPGAHVFPREARDVVVKFFQTQAKP